MRLTTLIIITTMVSMPILSQDWTSDEAMEAHFIEQSKILNAIMERAKKALANNDDEALKNEIFEIAYNIIGYAGADVDVFRGFIKDDIHGIPPKRAEKVLHDTIRKSLLDLFNENNEKRLRAQNDLYLAIDFLEALPSAETIALLSECIQSKNETIRNAATRSYIKIMGKTQNSTKNELMFNPTFEIKLPLEQPKKTSYNKLFESVDIKIYLW